MSNTVLNKHACVLWSSENRRHQHLSNPDSTSAELDDIMRRKWETLSEKEKLRFFQRAKDASRDENKHSSRRQNDDTSSSNTSEPEVKHPSVERFVKLKAVEQLEELKTWLQFYKEVSPEEYTYVMETFKENIAEEKKENELKAKELKELAKTKYKSKKVREKMKSSMQEEDIDSKYRRMLFETIFTSKDKILGMWTEKRKRQAQIFRERYYSTIRQLISGVEVHFSGNVRSDQLTNTLNDIRALERERKLAVSGRMIHGEEYQKQLRRLREKLSPEKFNLESLLKDEKLDAKRIENELKQIGHKELTPLSPTSVCSILGDDTGDSSPSGVDLLNIFQSELSMPSAIPGKCQPSPETVLTDWVADDILKTNPNLGFHGAVSLLSHKVHPSPAFVSPQLVNKILNNQSDKTPTLNNNQNSSLPTMAKCYRTAKLPYTHRKPTVSQTTQDYISGKYGVRLDSERMADDSCQVIRNPSMGHVIEGRKTDADGRFYVSTPSIVHGVQTSLNFTSIKSGTEHV